MCFILPVPDARPDESLRDYTVLDEGLRWLGMKNLNDCGGCC